MNSNRAGKEFEREVVNWFKDLGISARRTVQVDGTLVADVRLDHAPELHIECKRRKKLGVQRFMDQAIHDASGRAIPVVMVREVSRGKKNPSGSDLLMLIRAEDFELVADSLRQAKQRARRAGEANRNEGSNG